MSQQEKPGFYVFKKFGRFKVRTQKISNNIKFQFLNFFVLNHGYLDTHDLMHVPVISVLNHGYLDIHHLMYVPVSFLVIISYSS